MEEREDNVASKKVGAFIEKNKKVLVVLVIVLVCLLVGFTIGSIVGSNARVKDLNEIDTISFALTDGSASLEDAELETRRADAIAALQSFVKKPGVVGSRANMLCAEISYQQKKYEDSISYWNATVSKNKGAYTAPVANYNIAVCYEQLNKLDEAAANYKAAADSNDFVLKTHAKFSYGRVLETQGKIAEAVTVYTELDASNPSDTWAQLAKTRMIALKVEGKAE